MRHSSLRFAANCLFCALLGCTASGSDDQTHGPSFGPNDGGTDDAPRDAVPGTDAPAEGAAPDASTDAPTVDVDAPTDAPSDTRLDAGDSGSCTDKTALVAGNGTSFYEASQLGAGAWTVSTTVAPALSPPALVATAGGFLAAVRTSGDALKYTTNGGAGWSALAAIGAATTTAAPAIAAAGANVHLVYLGSNGKYYHGTYGGNAWDAASDPVGGLAAQSFGPTAVSMATVGGALLFSHRGGVGAQLYAEGWAAGAWSAMQVATAVSAPVQTATIAMNGGASDAMIVYLHDGDFKITYATRSGGTWTGPAQIDAALFANDPVAAAPIAGGKAVLVFRGTDKKAYASVWSGTAWSLPASGPLATGDLGGPPAVAPGACGDDAVAALPMAAGDVLVTRLSGGNWTTPAAVSGASGATSVAIATSN